MIKRQSLFLMLLLMHLPSLFAMNKVRLNKINDLIYQIPDEIWKLIFLAQNEWQPIDFKRNNWSDQSKAGVEWNTMKSIVNLSLVCKKFNIVAQILLPSYVKEIKAYIDKLGGKDQAAYIAYTRNEDGRYEVMEICKAMRVDLNTTKYTDMWGETLLTQAILKRDDHQAWLLLKKGADPKQPNKKGNMPIDLAYANGLLKTARIIKENGGDLYDKYEYGDGTLVYKQGQGMPQQINNLNAPNNAASQSSFFTSWIMRSPTYIFLGGISVGVVAYWFYTKYWIVDKDIEEEDDCLEADANSEGARLQKALA